MKRKSLRCLIFFHFFLCVVFLLFMQAGIVHLFIYPRQAETARQTVVHMVRIEAMKLGGHPLSELTGDALNQSAAELRLAGDDAIWLMDSSGALLLEPSAQETPLAGDTQAEEALSALALALEGEAYGVRDVSLSGQDILAFAEAPNTPGWKLCVFLDSGNVLAGPREYALASWMIWAALVALMTAATICLSGKVVKPLEQITRTIQEVGVDGGEVKVRCYGIAELDHLSKSISAMQLRIKGLFEHLVAEQEAKRDAERRMLQAQITPHFLYNTLDNIAWRATGCGNCQISDMVSALSAFFRISLSDGKEFITWDDEVEHAYSYLFIQQMRYEDKLDFDVDLDESMKDGRVVKLLLQPLVENALYHGIKPKEGKGSVLVRVWPETKDRVRVMVKDDGMGMSRERLAYVMEGVESGNCQAGFGLCTTFQRLRLTYGDLCDFSIESKQGEGTVILITLPLEYEGGEHG